jgi:predicted ATPase/DNA-binding SARP family transcriptional activator
MPLKLTLFGTFRIERDGDQLALGRRKAQALLAYLAVTGQPQRRDSLLALLWPEYEPAGARNNLRRELSNLKKVLGEELLVTDRSQVELNLAAGIWVDVGHFRAHLAGEETDTTEQEAGSVERLAEAVETYTADFMAGFSLADAAGFDEWLFFERESLRQALATALQTLIEYHIEQAETDRGILYARRWLSLDPLHETAQRELMRLYAWSGQQAAAIRQYEESVRLLDEELGVAPEEETTTLLEAIRRRKLVPWKGVGTRYRAGAEKTAKQQQDKDVGGLAPPLPEVRPSEPELPPVKAFPSGTITFLFTDIEGSSRLWEKHPAVMGPALARHDQILRATVEDNEGIVVKMRGDGVHAVFASVRQAVEAALAGQQALQSEPWAAAIGQLEARMGIHTGPAELRDGDYFGPTVNRAARIQDVGHGGQILLSSASRGIVHDHLPADVTLIDLGEFNIRDFLQPESVYQLAWPGSKTTYPPLKAPSRKRANLPEQTTSFIGREEELAEIGRLLRDEADCRVLTLVGPGGMGKTRLAIQAANQLSDGFPDGTFFAPLAPISSAEFLATTVADAVGITYRSGSDIENQLLGFLGRKRSLLVMDNFEHLMNPDGASHGGASVELLFKIITAAPEVKLLVTSRERLNLQEEWVFDVGGLTIPYELAQLEPEAYSGMALFLERARQARRGFKPTAEDIPQVVNICRLVGGMPLGLELAAAWLKMLSPAEIVREIESGLDFLATTMRNVPERHRSLRAVFHYSWEMLSGEERAVFRKLSVFRGGFRREAAEEVAGAGLASLFALADKSLLKRRQNGRYEIHELLRQYAAERLAADEAGSTAIRDRHSAHYCAFLGQQAHALKSEGVLEALAKIGEDLENVRLAWEWAVEQGQWASLESAAESLGWFYYWPARHKEGLVAFKHAAEQLEHAVAQSTQPNGKDLRLWTKLLGWQGSFASQLGTAKEAVELAQRAVDILDRSELIHQDVRAERAFALEVLGKTQELLGKDDVASAITAAEQSLVLYRALEDRWGIAYVLARLAQFNYYSGLDSAIAESRYMESWTLMQALGHPLQKVWLSLNLGRIMTRQGRFEEAADWLKRGREISRQNSYLPGVTSGLLYSAELSIEQGRCAHALTLLDDVVALRKDLEASSIFEGWVEEYQSTASLHQGLYQEATNYATLTITKFEQREHVRGVAWGCYLLANSKIAQDENREALALLQKGAKICRELGQKPLLNKIRIPQSYILLREGQLTHARQLLGDVLSFGLDHQIFVDVLTALPAIALLRIEEGKVEQAIELYALASSHPYVGNSRWFADIAGHQSEAVAESLPEEAAAKARERGRTADLWATAEALLAGLDRSP